MDLEPIREGLRAAGADALWIHPGVDLRHLTGLAPIAMERPTALVVLASGGLRALAPEMLAPELAEVEGADVVAWSDGEGPEAAIARVLDGIRVLLVGPRSRTASRPRSARRGPVWTSRWTPGSWRDCASARARASSSTCASPAATRTRRPPGSPGSRWRA